LVVVVSGIFHSCHCLLSAKTNEKVGLLVKMSQQQPKPMRADPFQGCRGVRGVANSHKKEARV
jgi:hypothetical protein